MKYCFLFILVTLCFASCSTYSSESLDKQDELLESVISDYKNAMTRQHNVVLSGTGGAMMDKIKVIYLSFRVCREVNLEEARKLHVQLASELLNRINNNTELRPFLESYPYTERGLELQVTYYRNNGQKQLDQFIGSVIMMNGRITYDIYKDNINAYYQVHQETYQEALKIVESQKKVSPYE